MLEEDQEEEEEGQEQQEHQEGKEEKEPGAVRKGKRKRQQQKRREQQLEKGERGSAPQFVVGQAVQVVAGAPGLPPPLSKGAWVQIVDYDSDSETCWEVKVGESERKSDYEMVGRGFGMLGKTAGPARSMCETLLCGESMTSRPLPFT